MKSSPEIDFFGLVLTPIVSHGERQAASSLLQRRPNKSSRNKRCWPSERLAATGRMAHTIAHEINNPLEAIINLVYLLQGSLDTPEVARQYLRHNRRGAGARLSHLPADFVFQSRILLTVEIRICDLIDDVLALNNRELVEKGLQLRRDWNRSLTIQGFPAQLRQVFSNIVRNAVEASFPGGEIRIKISPSRLGRDLAEPAVRVTVADQGAGIAAENRARVFDAFFTTKDLKGSGVGLWLSASIVHQHGGRLRVRSSTRLSGSGTCLSVLLPCSSPDPQLQLRSRA